MPLPKTISDYLRAHAQGLGNRILQSFPHLHAIGDPQSPMICKLLRKPYPAQTLAIMGLVRRWQQTWAGAVIAECGTGKTLISLAAVLRHRATHLGHSPLPPATLPCSLAHRSAVTVEMDQPLKTAHEDLEQDIKKVLREHRGNQSVASVALNALLQ